MKKYSRKDIIKKIRENVLIDSVYVYSDKQKNSQRWKCWSVWGDHKAIADAIRCVISTNNFPGLTVKTFPGRTQWGPINNISIHFPHSLYS